jgi:molybdate transport system ATP-binding protein
MTTIMISHDLTGIYHLANRVVILNHGKIIDDGNPRDVLLKGEINDGLTFEGKLLDIIRVNFRDIAIISIGQRVVKININSGEAKNLEIGSRVLIYAKSFNIR